MDFRKRLRLFIIGILLGSGFVWVFLFRGRDFPAWTPQGRVLETLRENPIKISAKARCKMECLGVTGDDIVTLLNNAEVKFGDSNIRNREIPEYLLEGKGQDSRAHKMMFRSEYKSTYLIDIQEDYEGKSCSCESR
ncbi:MAG: hypothetical protein R2850_02940 [Bacteroidia bacterium]